METRICLTCKHWRRHLDEVIGTCAIVGGERWTNGLRFQYETCDKAFPSSWEFGENRAPCGRDGHNEDDLVNKWGKLNIHKVNRYYATALFEGL